MVGSHCYLSRDEVCMCCTLPAQLYGPGPRIAGVFPLCSILKPSLRTLLVPPSVSCPPTRQCQVSGKICGGYEWKAVIVTMSELRSACGAYVRYMSLKLMPRLGTLNFPTFVCGVALLQTRRLLPKTRRLLAKINFCHCH